jgi:hypothetical protein
VHIVLPGFAAILTAALPFAVIVNVIELDVAVVGEAQAAFDVNPQVSASPLANVVDV